MKVKEFHYKQLENDFELDLSYQEWLMEHFTEPSEAEIDEMEKSFKKPSTVDNRIITHKPSNNQDYDPTHSA